MNVKEYITEKFSAFGINLTDADLLDVSLGSGLDEEEEIDCDNINLLNLGLIDFIPQMLLRATSVSESGFSMSWDTNGIKTYYSMLCEKYGKEDILTEKPRISFL